jgi:hypothetical protein
MSPRDARKVIEGTWAKYSQSLAIFSAKGACCAGAGCYPNASVSRFTSLIPLFESASESLGKIGERISDTARAICLLAPRVDYASDFRAFTTKSDLKFIDISPPPFARFKFASHYNAPDVRPIETFTMRYLPSFIAIAKADFAPASPDELPLKAGQAIYLMQAPREQWLFAMTRAHAHYGWVPASFVDVRGVGIAVVIDPGGAKAFTGRARSLLVLVGTDSGGAVICEDLRHRRFAFKRAAVAIL